MPSGLEIEIDVLGREQRLVLARQAGVGRGEDLLEIVDRQRCELDADRKTPLQLRDQIRRLGQMKCAAGDEQDVVGLDHPVLGRDRRALDQRQQIALHALARHVGALHFLAAGDLVDLVEEDDAVLLDVVERLGLELVVVDQLAGFLVDQRLQRLADIHFLQLALAARHLLEHALDLAGQVFHARGRENLHLRRHRRELDLDLLVVELAFAQHLAEFLARGRIGRLHVVEVHFARRRQQRIEHALLGGVGGAVANLARFGLARLLDRRLGEVADDRVDVAADVADFGELGRLDLDERRVGELRQPARDLGLADAGRSDHQDVLGRDLLPQRVGDLLTPPAIAKRDGDGALGRVLADDVLVQLVDDFLRSHRRHGGVAAARKKKRPPTSGGRIILPVSAHGAVSGRPALPQGTNRAAQCPG